MSARVVHVQTAGVRTPVSAARLAQLSTAVLQILKVRRAEVSITLVTPQAIARLNRLHLGHRGPTDVITFALGTDPSGTLLADMYICPAVARAHALTHGVSIREELARLVVHGTLHACGWDHPEDDSRLASPMWRRQEQLVRRLWTQPALST